MSVASLPPSDSAFSSSWAAVVCYIWAPRGRKYDARGQSVAVHAAKAASLAGVYINWYHNWHRYDIWENAFGGEALDTFVLSGVIDSSSFC